MIVSRFVMEAEGSALEARGAGGSELDHQSWGNLPRPSRPDGVLTSQA